MQDPQLSSNQQHPELGLLKKSYNNTGRLIYPVLGLITSVIYLFFLWYFGLSISCLLWLSQVLRYSWPGFVQKQEDYFLV